MLGSRKLAHPKMQIDHRTSPGWLPFPRSRYLWTGPSLGRHLLVVACIYTSRSGIGLLAGSSVAERDAMEFKVETTSAGDGKSYPQTGDECEMHYTGTLQDGSTFDSSISRGKTFKFKLGVGQVIEAWDKGVAKMSKGEKAIIYAPAAMAYGSSGAGGVIPPNADLQFEVELIGFRTPSKDEEEGCTLS